MIVALFAVVLTRRLVARFGLRPVMFTGMALLVLAPLLRWR